MNGGMRIPRASRPFESPMPVPVRHREGTRPPDASFLAARAREAEADTAQRIATYPSVIDAERHPLYGHGVQHEASVHVPGEERKRAPAVRSSPNGGGAVASEREAERLSRLSRWQEQR